MVLGRGSDVEGKGGGWGVMVLVRSGLELTVGILIKVMLRCWDMLVGTGPHAALSASATLDQLVTWY